MGMKNELAKIFGNGIQPVEGCKGELYATIARKGLEPTVKLLYDAGFELVSLFCAENFQQSGFTLFYAFEKKGCAELLVLQLPLDGKPTSIAGTFPSACWYEREVHDGFGIEFENSFDKRRLFLHEAYSEDFHPLLKSVKNQPIKAKRKIEDNYHFKLVKGEGVYQIPVGPVHAGIIEPGHFRFSVIGETIFNLEVRMFYKHRGIEKLAEGKSPDACVQIAEAISGDESVANAVAFCNAIEKISGITVPRRALQLRAVLLELERVYSYLGDMAGMIIDVAYPIGASPFFILREEIFRQNEALAGSRFLKDMVGIGGLKKDISSDALASLSSYLVSFEKRFNESIQIRHNYFSLIDRFEAAGVVKKELLSPLHITGPIARASGSQADVRIDHPYGLYCGLKLQRRAQQNGDVLSRFNLKAMELRDSLDIIKGILHTLHGGAVQGDCTIKDGYAASMVEAARGQSFQWVCIKGGLVDRYKVRTASFCNWQAIEHAVLGNIVPDFPLINKSMNLSYAGTDL